VNITITLDTNAKFWAVLEALQQYIDNCEDAEHLIDNGVIDEFYRKIGAAEEIRDQLDARLASLADG
jgi:prephenate dehydrogenase